MAETRDQVAVVLDAEEIVPRFGVGTLFRERAAGKSVIAFAYEPAWLASARAFP